MKDIIEFLNRILDYDWNKFNQIKDMFHQSNEWKTLINEFDEILLKNTEYILNNSDEVKQKISSYNQNFQNLNINGKLHIVVDKYRIKGYLIEKVNNHIFQNFAKKDSCECRQRKELQLDPNFDTINKIRRDFDGYYYSDIYRCNECNTIWILENLDDGTVRWEKH